MTDRPSHQDRLAELHDRLAREVTALQTGDDWQRWLKVAARLHDYSFQNTLLILSQRPDATTVAGYQTWKALGHQVNRGEKGIAVLAPIVRRAPKPETPDDVAEPPDEARPRSVIAGFRVTYVWDVSQTSGPPLPAPPTPQLLQGRAPDGLWETLAELTADAGFTLHRRDCDGANGVTDFGTHTVTVRPDVDDAQAVKTLAHELGHVRLHSPEQLGELAGRLACAGLIEVEAESVAYLVATTHGMDTSTYTFPYVAGWAGAVAGHEPADVVRITGERVLSAARWVLARTELAVAAPQQPMRLHARDRERAPRPGPAGMQEPASAGPDVPREPLIAVHAEAAAFFRRQVEQSWVPPYLRARRLEAALHEPWNAGRAPAGWTTLVSHLRRQGVDDATLLASGLAIRARTGRLIDTFRDRLVLPLRDDDGQVIGFIGRAHPDASHRTPKYLNSPRTALYSKGGHVYGLTESRELLRTGAVPVLVEGPLDAIAVTVAMNGQGIGMAICGTALTSTQVDRIDAALGTADRALVVGFDNDAAGQRAIDDALDLFATHGRELLAARWPEGRDPADVLQRFGPTAVSAVLECPVPLVDRVVDRRLDRCVGPFSAAGGRVGGTRSVGPLMAGPSADSAQRQIDRASQRPPHSGQPRKPRAR